MHRAVELELNRKLGWQEAESRDGVSEQRGPNPGASRGPPAPGQASGKGRCSAWSPPPVKGKGCVASAVSCLPPGLRVRGDELRVSAWVFCPLLPCCVTLSCCWSLGDSEAPGTEPLAVPGCGKDTGGLLTRLFSRGSWLWLWLFLKAQVPTEPL